MEGVRVQVFFFLLSLSLVFLTTTARSSESDASRQDELEQLRFKIDALESTIVDKNRELKSKDGTILHMEKIIQEKSEGINSLQRELESIQKKDYLNDVELLEKANAQVAKLGKQVHELQDEIRSEKQKRVELEGRASKAEKETKEIIVKLEALQRTSDDQKRMFEKTERSLKIAKDELLKAQSEAALKKKELAEIHASWFPPWLAIHMDHYLDMAASHWNRHAKPALDVLSKEVSKIPCWAQKHMEPYWHLVKFVQAFAQERLKKHELTEALATKELAWFLASAVLALPVYLFYKLLKTIFWKRSRKSSHKSQEGQAHRKHRRRHVQQ